MFKVSTRKMKLNIIKGEAWKKLLESWTMETKLGAGRQLTIERESFHYSTYSLQFLHEVVFAKTSTKPWRNFENNWEYLIYFGNYSDLLAWSSWFIFFDVITHKKWICRKMNQTPLESWRNCWTVESEPLSHRAECIFFNKKIIKWELFRKLRKIFYHKRKWLDVIALSKQSGTMSKLTKNWRALLNY